MKRPEIDPERVKLDVQGYEHQRWSVTLPAGMLADELRDPGAWRRVQATRGKGFRQHDEVLAIGDGFLVMAIVTEARSDSAVLAFTKIISTDAPRTTPLFATDKLRVVWNGGTFSIVQIADGRILPQTFANEAGAIAYITGMRGAA